MVRSPMKSETDNGLKKGPWTGEEDEKLKDYIEKHGHGSWQSLPRRAGLNRCGKSCRLRWSNYLRPDIKRGNFSPQEVQTIIDLHSTLGNKWAMIATRLPGRTDNEIKNYWNTHLRKKLIRAGIDPQTHQLITDLSFLQNLNNFPMMSSFQNMANFRLLENIVRFLSSNPLPPSLLVGSHSHTLNSNPSLHLPSPLPNLENGPLSCDYKPISDTFRPPEIQQGMEYCLPGLASDISSAHAGNGTICDYSVGNRDFEELLVDNINHDEEGAHSFWKDILYESFPSFSM